MKKLLFIAVLLMGTITALQAQQITGAEYYFDSDPGVGNGMPLSIVTSGDTVTQQLNISTAGLTEGPHFFNLRTRNANGKWSQQTSRIFYIRAAHAQQPVTAAEYFIDTDPGAGNGIPVSILSTGDTVLQQLSVNTTGLNSGPHFFCLRTRDADGTWSHHVSRTFFIIRAAVKESVTAAEYFIDTDPGPGNGIALAVTPGDSVSNSFIITNPFPSGTHYLGLRTLDAGGNWSLQNAITYNVCSTYGPKAEFDFFIDRKNVFFNNYSLYDTSFIWNFGQGSPTTVQRNPLHTYTLAGNYNVCLNVANSCGSESKCQTVSITGIQSITPSFSADSNLLISMVRGINLNPGASVYLTSTGGPTITADSVIYIDNTRLKVIFKFNHAPIGTYNVVLTNPSFPNDTLYDGFRIEAPRNGGLSINFSGATRLRPFTSAFFSYGVKNKSNRTLYMIPVYIYIYNDSLFTYSITSNITVDPSVPSSAISLMPPDHIYSVPDPANPNNPPVKMIALMLPYLPPGDEAVLDLSVKLNSNNFHCTKVSAKVGSPLDDHFINPLTNSCNFLPNSLKCAMDLAGLIPGIGCVTGAANFGCSIGNQINDAIWGTTHTNWYDIPVNFGGMLISCVPNGWTNIKKMEYAVSVISDLSNGVAAMSDCGNAAADFLNWDPYDLQPKENYICRSNSSDPNIKQGPEGISSDNYINKYNDVHYTVKFENENTATAPAAVVEITDQLDTSRFDLSTFSFRQFGFGDTSFVLEQEFSQRFMQDIDLRPTRGIWLRVNAQLNKLSGLINWMFVSLDTVNFDTITDPLLGFLPPNNSSPEGEGFIRYSVKPKTGLLHGDVISNTASIVFDRNAPIVTNTWINTIDTIKPLSSIQPLAATQLDTSFFLKMIGTDADAGVQDYVIYASVNDGAFQQVFNGAPDSLYFTGRTGVQYEFFSQARDRVGNIEDTVHAGDAITVIVVGIDRFDNQFSVELFPNPGKTSINLRILTTAESILKATIYSLEGKKITDIRITPNADNVIPLDEFHAGSYYIKIATDKKQYLVKKIIVVK